MATKMTLIVVPEMKADGSFWVDMFVAQHDADADIEKQVEEIRAAGATELAATNVNPLTCVCEEELEKRGIYKLEPLIHNMSDGRFMLGGLLFDAQIILRGNQVPKCVDGTVKSL